MYNYFFAKNDMILPWEPFVDVFFAFMDDDGCISGGVGFFAGGVISSSEKDSHPGS